MTWSKNTPESHTSIESLGKDIQSGKLALVVGGVTRDFDQVLWDDKKTLTLVEGILWGESFLLKESRVQQSIGAILYARKGKHEEGEIWIWDITTELNVLRKIVREKEEA